MKNPLQPEMELFALGTRRNIKACFECGHVGNIHEHHVVPKVLGGTKTIPLCETCHGKVHDRDIVSHRRLVRAGLAKARERGRTLGRPVGSTMDTADLLAKHADVVKLLRASQSIRHTAKISGKAKGTVETVKRSLDETSSR